MANFRKNVIRVFLLVLVLALLTGTASADWKKEKYETYDWDKGEWVWKESWFYYGADGKKTNDFTGQKVIEIPAEVDSLDRNAFVNLSRDAVLKVKKGSYAEKYAKQYGYQYDNGEKRVVGYNIDNMEDKADWIIANYITDNYKGSKLTEEETARVLHDWLTTNATYDMYGLDVQERVHTYAPEGVLLDGTGVCDSYAQAYSYLLNKVNIRNRYIAGDTGGNLDNTNHAWDLVLIDGQWYHTDATWDDPNGETAVDAPITTGYEGYDHYLVSDAGIKVHSPKRIWDDQVSADDNVVGFVFTDNGTYFYGDASEKAKATTGWKEIDHNDDYSGGYFWTYNPVKNEKQYIDEGKYYFGQDGKMATDWANIDSKRYFFNENGLMQTGWQDQKDGKYHLSDSGAADIGMTDLTEKYLQYNSSTGQWDEKTGVFTYYFDQNGKMQVGFIDANGKTYHMADNGRMDKDNWIHENGTTYYAGKDGTMLKGLNTLASEYLIWDDSVGDYVQAYDTYYFDKKGKMQVGFVDTNGNLYYMDENGRMKKDAWIEDKGDKYHAGSNGALQKGFQTLNNGYMQWNSETNQWEDIYSLYYFGNDCKMVKGIFRVDGALHYSNRRTGEVTDDLTEGFVDRCYLLILDREADEAGLADWTNQLKQGAKTAAEIVGGFVNSQEFSNQNNSYEDTVEVLYNTMLCRGSDPAGKADWVSWLASGCSNNAVINGFCGSQEFTGLCQEFKIIPGSVTPEQRDRNKNLTAFVNRCYSEALNRSGEPGGLNYWCGEIISGAQSPKQVAHGFVFSQEMADRGMSSEETIDMLYRLYLGRGADEAGKQYWIEQTQNGMTMEQLNDGFANSVEFAGIVESYGLR